MKLRPLVTLFTDASWCPEQRVAAYAAWFKIDGVAHRHSGVLKGGFNGSGEAEAAALVNGLWHVARTVGPSHVIIQTDSKETIRLLTGRNKADTDRRQKAVQAWQAIQAKAQLTVELRHVKGHKGNATPRHAVNSWCDKEARRHLRAARRNNALDGQSVLSDLPLVRDREGNNDPSAGTP